jgi:hypothetical protein
MPGTPIKPAIAIPVAASSARNRSLLIISISQSTKERKERKKERKKERRRKEYRAYLYDKG